MKIKKVILMTAAFMLVAGGSALADEVSVTMNGSKISVSGTADTDVVSIKVLPEASAENDIASLYEIAEVAVTDGVFSYDFEMPDTFDGVTVDGKFTVYTFGTEKKTAVFDYISVEGRESFAESLNGDNLKEIFEDENNERYFSALGADVSFYKNMTDAEKESFIKLLKSEIGEGTFTTENVAAEVKNAHVLEKAQSKIDESLVAESDVSFEGKTFAEEDDADKKEWIVSYLETQKPYDTSEKMQEAYNDANILFILQTAKYTEYDAVIEKYDSAIQIKGTDYYTKYLSMSDVKKNSVNEDVKKQSKTFTTYEAFLKAYKDAVASVKTNSNNGGGGGSSSGGSSKKDKNTSLVISPSASEQVSTPVEKKTFSDVAESHWAAEAVSALASKEIISGYEDNSFRPDNQITREEFVKIIVSALELTTSGGKSQFTDVDENAWYTPYVNAAASKKLVSGREDGTFGVGEKITREEMAVIVRRAITHYTATRVYEPFADEEEISEYALESVKDLYVAGFVNGLSETEFSPKSNVTRAQAAKIIYDAFIK